jgi:serine/threonine-protein kinase
VKDLDVGQVIASKYVLVRLLGAGAMGQVWVARHQALQQTFAVKLMIAPPGDDAIQTHEGMATSLKRFENEAQIAAALSRKSRHIVGVSDYGIDDGVAYLVMELLEGDGLDRHIGDGRKLHPAEVSNVVTQIAKGLAVAHAEGVTHRDLKPANVFLTQSEEGDLLVKVLDFGIARMARHIVKNDARAPTRLTMKGMVLGSPAYMSPEQAMAEPTDVRADVWALAVLAFEALSGVTPFFAETADDTIVRICNFRPTPLRAVLDAASEELGAVFTRAFTTNIFKRFQTAPELAAALVAALPAPAPRLVSLRPGPNAPRSQVPTEIEGVVSLKVPLRPRRLGPALAIGAGAGLLIAGALFGPRLLSTPAPVGHADPVVTPAPHLPPVVVTASALPVAEPAQVASSHGASVGDSTRRAAQTPPSVVPTAPTTMTTPHASATQQPTSPAPSKSVDRSAIF